MFGLCWEGGGIGRVFFSSSFTSLPLRMGMGMIADDCCYVGI